MKHTTTNRLFSLLLALCLLLALAACGQSAAPAATETPETAPVTEAPAKTDAEETSDAEETPDAEPKPAATAAPGDAGSGLYVSTTGEKATAEAEIAESGKALAPGAAGDGGAFLMESSLAYGGGAGAGSIGGELFVDPAIYGDSDEAPDVMPPVEYDPGEPFVLTAAEWKDNDNWPFFTNLVNAGTISFPSFGIDPRNRVKVTVLDDDRGPCQGETVALLDAAGTETLWTARTDKDGAAYLFFPEGVTPGYVTLPDHGADELTPLRLRTEPGEGQQGAPVVTGVEDVELIVDAASPAQGAQVMFIVDTTGSMSDELSYLQKDFSSIAGEFDGRGIEWSACFYRDEGDDYVTKCSEFTADVAAIQELINSEYADGGGDMPEAVAEILDETLTMSFLQDRDRSGWREETVKLAFLIFDAPPHYGKEDVLDAAIRRAAAAGIRLIPVVASNADRDTELFGRAIAICTGGTYVFLTDDSGVGGSHLEPIVGAYTVEKLHDLIVRVLTERLPG